MFLRASDDWEGAVKRLLEMGGILVYPTDTVYGLGCDAESVESIRQIERIKGERGTKPFPVLVSSVETAFEVGVFSELAHALAMRYWPGQLTLVIPRKNGHLEHAALGASTVGLRVPADPIAMKIAQLSPSGCVIGTSANRSGLPPATSVQVLDPEVALRVDAVLDDGPRNGQPSTVVEVVGDTVRILRKGRLDPISDMGLW